MRRAPKEEDEEDEGALKEDESRPRRTLGTKEVPKTPQNPTAAPTILHSQAEFLGPRARYVTISVSLRGGASGLARPSPANRDGHMADRAAPKTPPATAKDWTASGGFRGGPWANLGS